MDAITVEIVFVEDTSPGSKRAGDAAQTGHERLGFLQHLRCDIIEARVRLRRTFTCLRSLTAATSLKHVKNVVLVPPADRFFAAYLLRPHWLGHIAL
jgi:hypothetical protein